jgi:hypothetical protein
MFQERVLGRTVWEEIPEAVMRECMERFTNPRDGMTVDYFVSCLRKGETRQVGYADYRFWPKGKMGNPSL